MVSFYDDAVYSIQEPSYLSTSHTTKDGAESIVLLLEL